MIEEKEVRLLIKGQEFTGEFQGVSYEIGVYWDEDWCVRVDIVSFNKMPEQIVEEYLYDAIYKLPEVLEFQKRIDAMGEVSQDALDDIIEKLENEE